MFNILGEVTPFIALLAAWVTITGSLYMSEPHLQSNTTALQLLRCGLSLGLCLATSICLGTSALQPLPTQAKLSGGLSLYIAALTTMLPAAPNGKPSETLSVSPHNRVASAHNSIVVNSATDDRGSGCTLREAIEAANTDNAVGGCTAGNGNDTITFAPALNGRTITLAGTHLSLTSTLSIDGGGVITISGNNASGVISVGQSISVTLTGLTIRDGTGFEVGPFVYGGGIYGDGSVITIINSTVALNTARIGGGIFGSRYSSLTIINSTVTSNTATHQGGGISVFQSDITLTNSNIEANTAKDGGGIYSYSSIMLITNSKVLSNKAASGYGGGIFQFQLSNSSATIANSCIVNNNDVALFAELLGTSTGITATHNWWGSATGPSGGRSGTGDSVSGNVDYSNFLTNPILGCPKSSSPFQPAVPTTDFSQKQINEAQVQLAVATVATDIKVVPSGAGAGNNKTYEISLVVQNTSPATAPAVLSSLTIPSSLNVLSVRWAKEGQYYVDGNLPRACSYDGRTAYCGIGQLWAGMKAIIILRVTAPPGIYSVGSSAEDLSPLYDVTTQNRATVNINLN